MDSAVEAPAGAPTETVSAERVAAEAGNFTALQQASRERRAGKAPASVERPKAEPEKPAAAVAARIVPGKDGQPAKGPADKDREADERLTARIRDAVTPLQAKNQELEAQLAAIRRANPTPDKPAATGGAPADKPTERRALTSAEIKAYQAKPGAPKLDDKDATGAFLYETAHEHAVALSEFIREERAAEAETAAKTSTARVERVKREAARVTGFAERVTAFKAAHPDRLIDNGKGEQVALPLSTDVAQLHGYGKLAEINADRTSKGLAPVAATVDHAIAEELYDSAIPMECALFLSAHPEELAALRQAQTPAQLTRAFGALEQKVRSTTTPPAPAAASAIPAKETTAEARRKAEEAVDRSVSSTKPLSGNLGRPGTADRDPKETAIAKNDVGMFMEIERQKRIEILQGRRR